MLAHPMYDHDWLGSPESLANVMNWIARDTEAEVGRKAMEKMEGQKYSDSAALVQMMNAPGNIQRVLDMMSMADEGFYTLPNFETFHPEAPRRAQFRMWTWPTDKKVPIGDWIPGDDRRGSQGHWSIGKSWKRDYPHHPECEVCGKNPANTGIFITARHYQQLALLAGVKVGELPAYWRAFRAHNHLPYTGNSILDNTHPLLSIDHPSWNYKPNGIDIALRLCKMCARKAKKNRIAPAAVVDKFGNVTPQTLRAMVSHPGFVISSKKTH